MKIHYYIIFLAVFNITACASSEKKIEPVDKEKAPDIDFKAMGLENLRESSVMKDILCQDWDYKEDQDEVKNIEITSDLEAVYRGYCFFSDGTVTKDPRGALRNGKWTLEITKPISISMVFEDSWDDRKQLAYLKPSEMILSEQLGDNRKKEILIAGAFRHINLKEDPFYRDNVLWRTKPSSKETDEAIRQRLKDCIHFFALFYEEKINVQVKTVTFVGLPTCFTWYSGAVGLQDEDVLQKKWIDCFYNKEQAMIAYHIAGKLMKIKLSLPKKESSWLKANLAILKEMEKKIDSISIDRGKLIIDNGKTLSNGH